MLTVPMFVLNESHVMVDRNHNDIIINIVIFHPSSKYCKRSLLYRGKLDIKEGSDDLDDN